ncbi:hypothetical protein FISHEDRAFT_71957 [Fistulina hepatica ATCC 64428]|uniref:RING-type domain-containing protein n=1 Tax=Fistulina hepatica ATCC 64428 TaxID=1128425 RepID=A0A0D7AHP4_9AGAR|nr:hypothetical protein FISHEDRAFT_71957 [Fistulina hepatica ATCC 64428]
MDAPANGYSTDNINTAIAGGLNVTDVSRLQLQWYSNGSDSQHVSYQLVGSNSTGFSQGALVHFSELHVDNDTAPTLTPWIAFVSCDYNASNMSYEVDIFTLARNKGAVSALLYSTEHTACVINPEYANPANFDQVFDIFSTQSRTSASLIEYEFGQTGNASLYSNYSSSRLNASAEAINRTIHTGSPVAPGYLFASLIAYNATVNVTTSGSKSQSQADKGSSSSNTALAMIVLYVITGCVSAMFCLVIVSGAVRALRHPDRYGPRGYRQGSGGARQTRAQGLTRAILDTFPIVKFGTRSDQPGDDRPVKDVEDKPSAITMVSLHRETSSTPATEEDVDTRGDVAEHDENTGDTDRRPVGPPGTAAQAEEECVAPEDIGTETCPICIVDFEQGDDLRVLPCEGKHRFHQKCVDPWLLELSSSCPICRHDFLALENMLSGGQSSEEEMSSSSEPVAPEGASHPTPSSSPQQSQQPRQRTMSSHRFRRYLRFARNRTHRTSADSLPASNTQGPVGAHISGHRRSMTPSPLPALHNVATLL